MPGTTARMFLPYPAGGDANNTPLYMQGLADDIDAKLSQVLTIAGRDALTARQGMRVITSDGGGTSIITESVRDASAWLNMSRYSQGGIATRPAANTVLPGHRFFATDMNVMYHSDGTNWLRPGDPAGVVHDFLGAEGSVPLGFVLPRGQDLSRTGIYADLFAIYGTTYGSGDGSTTFTMPDARGLVFACRDTLGGSQVGTVQYRTGATLGAKQGEKEHTQITAELAAHGHGVGDPGHIHGAGILSDWTGSGSAGSARQGAGYPGFVGVTVNSAYAGVWITNTGSSSPMQWMQPTMTVNKMIRI